MAAWCSIGGEDEPRPAGRSVWSVLPRVSWLAWRERGGRRRGVLLLVETSWRPQTGGTAGGARCGPAEAGGGALSRAGFSGGAQDGVAGLGQGLAIPAEVEAAAFLRWSALRTMRSAVTTRLRSSIRSLLTRKLL